MEREVSLIFDIETDGLLYNVTTIHCLAIHDLATNQTISYNDEGNQEPILGVYSDLQMLIRSLVTT